MTAVAVVGFATVPGAVSFASDVEIAAVAAVVVGFAVVGFDFVADDAAVVAAAVVGFDVVGFAVDSAVKNWSG